MPGSLRFPMVTAAEGCRVRDPAPRAGEVLSWSGPCINELGEGRGTLVWRSPPPSAGNADAGGLALTSEFFGGMRGRFEDLSRRVLTWPNLRGTRQLWPCLRRAQAWGFVALCIAIMFEQGH